MNEEASADDCEVKGEEESGEGEESHGGGNRRWDSFFPELDIYPRGWKWRRFE